MRRAETECACFGVSLASLELAAGSGKPCVTAFVEESGFSMPLSTSMLAPGSVYIICNIYIVIYYNVYKQMWTLTLEAREKKDTMTVMGFVFDSRCT